MMMRRDRIQVVEIGATALKSLLITTRKGAQPLLEEVRAVPLPRRPETFDALLESIRPPFQSMTRKFFKKGTPVHVVLGDHDARTSVAIFSRVPEENAATVIHRSYTDFHHSFGVRDRVTGISVPVEKRLDDGLAQLSLVHSFIREAHIESLHRFLKHEDLILASLLPAPLVEIELVRRWASRGDAVEDAPGLVVHAGHATTRVYLLENRRIRGARVLHTGARDFMLDLEEGIEALSGKSFQDLEKILRGGGLHGKFDQVQDLLASREDQARARELLAARRFRYARAIVLAMGQLARAAAPPPGEDEDEVEPVVEGSILVTGGLATCPGLTEALSDASGKPAHVLDPIALVPVRRKLILPTPPSMMTGTIGAYLWSTRPDAEIGNLANDFLKIHEGEIQPPSLLSAFDLRTLVASVAVAMMVLISNLVQANRIALEVTQEEAALDEQRQQLPEVAAGKDLLMKYRDARNREVTAATRLTYVQSLMDQTADWPRLFDEVHGAQPPGKLAMDRIRVSSTWPRSQGGASGRTPKMFHLVVDGESEKLDTVTQLVQGFTAEPFFVAPKLASSQMVEDTADGEAVSYKLYRYQVKGEVDFQK